MRYVEPVFRPPSEAKSLLLQASIGCSNNTCTFCGSNLVKKFGIRPLEEIREDILEARALYGERVRRVFLLDSNALCMRTEDLLEILNLLYAVFPYLERIGVYACAADALEKSPEDLRKLFKAGLKIAYLGVESGDDVILKRVRKGISAEQTIEGCKRIMDSGITLSVTIILGLGGKERWRENAMETAKVINRINPPYVGALTLMVVPGTPLHKEVQEGRFQVLNPQEILQEMRLLVENLELTNCVFRSNHASNYLPLGGILPQDKEDILRVIDLALRKASRIPLRSEKHRRL
ncbi:MAG: radical SAM protein [Candidatus Jordarchaeum sp.]|uniref:radical SAM protein n=1 Tax=Candidatus Jordarchaeum sp. TaxID=2823881 RepID=UPI00404A401A